MKEKAKKPVSVPEKKIEVKQSTLFQKLLPHILAVAVFAFVTLLFFSPMILDNKIIQQSDIVQAKGMTKEIVDFREATGKEPLWTNGMFGGMPAYQISVKYKGNLFQYFDDIVTLGFPHPAELVFLAFITFYFLLLVFKVNPWLALAGAIAYGLSSYNLTLIEAGHNSKMHSIALMPLVVAGVILIRNKKYLWGGIISTTGLSLLVMANHLQITFYLLLMMMVYAIVELVYYIRGKDYRHLMTTVAVIIVAGIFAVITNLSLLWSTYDYVPSTIRGPSELSSNKQSTGGLDKDYAYAWSYGKMETFTLLIPNFMGGSSTTRLDENSSFGKVLDQYGVSPAQKKQYLEQAPMYWGDQPFTSGPFYVGAIVCFLFVFGLLMIRDRMRWWLLGAVILSIFLAWGKNFEWFSDLFFYHFPGYNKFRVPSMILVIAQFVFPLMSILLLSKILNGDYERKVLLKKLSYAGGITGGLCLFFALFGTSFLNFRATGDARYEEQQQVLDAIIADRKSLMRMDAFRSFIFISLTAGIIMVYVMGNVKRNLFLAGIIMLLFADLFFVGRRYLDSGDFVSKNEYDRYFNPTPADQLILKETAKDYRVLNLTANPWSDSRTSYHHKSVGGYHAAKLRRYQEIIENQLTQNDSAKQTGFPFNKSVIDMLNTKYLIVPNQQQEQVIPNFQALDNAWFADSIIMVNNADEEMKALNDFNPATTVIIDKRFSSHVEGLQPSYDSTASVILENYASNHLQYKCRSSGESVIVFSEIYYQPGWNSFIDGKKTDHFRCNYILRALRVPAGEHKIEFKFEPASYYMGEKIALAGSSLLLLSAVGLGIWEFMRSRRKKNSLSGIPLQKQAPNDV